MQDNYEQLHLLKQWRYRRENLKIYQKYFTESET